MVSPQNDNSGPLSGLPTFLPSPLYSLSPAHSQMNLLIPKSEQVMLCTKTSSGSGVLRVKTKTLKAAFKTPPYGRIPTSPPLTSLHSFPTHFTGSSPTLLQPH